MLTLHNKDFTTRYGAINSVIEAFVEEERNGLFELSFVMLNTDSLFQYVKEDNIVVANANNTLINQKFRIYMTRKLMNNRVEVFARHISFDLMYDYIDNISFENQSCEYALNLLFRNSQFSSHYKGYSDIINAQNYSMSMANVLEAIGGKKGSIIDTFGTGAELLRDNENIHVLNKRGHDNSVSIEYKKNLTGFELEEDTTELITRILPYARYTPEGGEEVIVKASFVDSSLIANYSHPFVKAIDYTDKFEEGEEVTNSKLIAFAQNEYKVNKVDMPKQNFKIEFIPLSKCLGYEPFEDSISLCDTVTIKDTRYNINTQAKVIKTIFNVLKNRYEAIELGEPKTSLGDIIGNNDSAKGEKGDKGDKGDKGEDGSIGDFPDNLPATPIVTTKVYGFANIEISWTFENKVYYQYEVYASKEANFTPNTFNLIHSGQTSTYMFQAKPDETWYFKVCAINTYGDRTNFGSAYATTVKINDLSNYVGEMAIGDALIGELNLGRGWVGTLKGNHIDAKNLSVTDGNGKRTLDIDSFGNVNLDVTTLNINSKNVATEEYAIERRDEAYNASLKDAKNYTNSQIQILDNSITSSVSSTYATKDEVGKTYATKSELTQTSNDFTFQITNTGAENLIKNSDFSAGLEQWEKNGHFTWYIPVSGSEISYNYGKMICIQNSGGGVGIFQRFNTIVGQKYTVSFYTEGFQQTPTDTVIGIEGVKTITLNVEPTFKRWSFTFTATSNSHTFVAYLGTAGKFYLGRVMVTQGTVLQEYRKHTSEIYSSTVKIDVNGVEIDSTGANTINKINTNGMIITDKSNNTDLLKATSSGVVARGGSFYVDDPSNGYTRLWGRDIDINGQRALVGTNSSPQDSMIANKLYINYDGDFKNGTEITGKLTNNSFNVLSDVGSSITQNGYMKLSNGLIIQWGHVKGLTISNGQIVDAHVKYPIDFPNAIITFIPSIDTVDGNNYIASRYNVIGKTNNNKTHGWVYAVNHTGTAQGALMDINYIVIGC